MREINQEPVEIPGTWLNRDARGGCGRDSGVGGCRRFPKWPQLALQRIHYDLNQASQVLSSGRHHGIRNAHDCERDQVAEDAPCRKIAKFAIVQRDCVTNR